MVHHERRPALRSAQLGVTCHTPPGAKGTAPSALHVNQVWDRLSESPRPHLKLAGIALARPSARLARLVEDSAFRLVGIHAQATFRERPVPRLGQALLSPRQTKTPAERLLVQARSGTPRDIGLRRSQSERSHTAP